MYHLQVSRWRRRRVAESMSGEMLDTADPDGDHCGRVDLQLALHAALSQLTARQRAVLVLRFFEDRTESEAAGMLGCSIGTDVRAEGAGRRPRTDRVRAPRRDVDHSRLG
jgi:DNA-directed RNA polymerase specialized sigma24 family protein